MLHYHAAVRSLAIPRGRQTVQRVGAVHRTGTYLPRLTLGGTCRGDRGDRRKVRIMEITGYEAIFPAQSNKTFLYPYMEFSQ